MKRTIEKRPKKRVYCDLRECIEQLDPHAEYPMLTAGDKDRFSGVRVFCTLDHRDEYEMRISLMASAARSRTAERRDDRIPGVTYGRAEEEFPQ